MCLTLAEMMSPDQLDRILYIRHTDSMKTVSYTDARNQLASLMEAANADREPVTSSSKRWRMALSTTLVLAPGSKT